MKNFPATGNSAIIAELSRRYSAEKDSQAETYDFIELCVAAGLRVGETLEFNLKKVSPKYYVGSGQFEQIAEHAKNSGCALVAISAPALPRASAQLGG